MRTVMQVGRGGQREGLWREMTRRSRAQCLNGDSDPKSVLMFKARCHLGRKEGRKVYIYF